MELFSCWPANLVAFITVLLILFDLVKQQWSDLPWHALGGIGVTGVFWFLCMFLGSSIAGAVLYVPLLFLIVFSLGIFFTTASLKKQGCCLTCASGPGPEIEAKPADDACSIAKRELKGTTIM